MAPSPPPDDLGEILEEYFEHDQNRFKVRHMRARAEAGPSLMGGPRGIEHWTYEYVRRQVDDCLRDVCILVLELAAERDFAPAAALPQVRAAVEAHFALMYEQLKEARDDNSVHEYGVRPSREALAQVREYGRRSLAEAMTALGQGKLPERLVPRIGPLRRLSMAVGGGDRLFLICAVAAAVLIMASVL